MILNVYYVIPLYNVISEKKECLKNVLLYLGFAHQHILLNRKTSYGGRWRQENLLPVTITGKTDLTEGSNFLQIKNRVGRWDQRKN